MAQQKMLNEDQTQVWRDRIIAAARSKKELVREWMQLQEWYQGRYHYSYANHDRVTVNWVLANTRQMTSMLYGQQPKMFFKPLGFMAEDAAWVMEQVVTAERRVMDCEKEERMWVHNCLLFGTGILKHGYNAEFSMDTAWADKTDQKSPTHRGTLIDDNQILPHAPLTEHNPQIKSGHPWVKSIHPMEFLVDPDANSPEDARWFCHRYRRPYLDVVQDERFPEHVRKKIEPSGNSVHWEEDELSYPHSINEDHQSEGEAAMVSIYEIFDRRTQTVIMMTDMGDMLLQEPYPYFGKDGPYEIIQFLPTDDCFWGMSWVETWSPQVQALNKLRTQMMDHLQRFGQIKGVYNQRTFDDEFMDDFARSPQGTLAPAKNMQPGEDIRKVIQFMPYIPIAADAWQLQDKMQFDMDQVSGISELGRGSGKSVQTATEAAYIEQRTQGRIDDMRRVLDRGLRRSTRKIVSMLKRFWGPERIIPLVGPDGQDWAMYAVSYDLVNSQYEVDIEPGSTERVDKNVRIRQMIDAMNTIGPYIQYLNAQGYDFDWSVLFKEFLEKTEVVRNAEKLIVPYGQAGMGAQMQQQQQMGGGGMGQQPAPMNVNNSGAMPWDNGGSEEGQVFKQAQAQGVPVAV